MDLSFFYSGIQPIDTITHSYDYSLVVLSFLIACLASYVALDLAGRLRAESNKKAKWILLIGSASAMGAGIWSMNFIGLMAFLTPFLGSYGLWWACFSIIQAVILSSLALFFLQILKHPFTALTVGGILLGLVIVSMQYTENAGMLHVTIRYNLIWFAASIIFAILASNAALWFSLQGSSGSLKRQILYKIFSGLTMGSAISGMHYIAMVSAVVTPNLAIQKSSYAIPAENLEFYIVGITAFLISFALVVATYRRLVVDPIENERDFLNVILDNLEDGIVACNSKGKITVINNAMKKMLGKKVDVNKRLYQTCQFFLPDGSLAVENPLFLALKGEAIHAEEFILKIHSQLVHHVIVNGQPILNLDDNTCLGAIIIVRDITKKKQMENQILRRKTHDSLTELPNRMLLIKRLEQAIHRIKEGNHHPFLALLFIDIDHFKLINETFGHMAGDELLQILARRLQKNFRESDTIARLSGDEFVVMVASLDTEESIITLAQKILEKMSQPFLLTQLIHPTAKQKAKVTVSIGVSSYPKNGKSATTLLKNAEAAAYRAKAQGRNTIKFFSEQMNLKIIKRLELEQYLHTALENNQYILHYQPIVDLQSGGDIVGFEALLRWQHPTLGLLLPIDFISLTEETGLIVSIGEWVLQTACAQNKEWQNQGLAPVRISVNMSVKQINESDLFKTVKQILYTTQLESKYLELELTESSVLQCPRKSLQTLTNLKELGVNIALDDFGTGYSNLSYLSRLPVSGLKIDKLFVHNLAERSEKAAIVLAIINLAASMKLKVTAEGVENYNELSFLSSNHCDEVQGYFFSRPLTVEQATKLLRETPKFNMQRPITG